jgi:hypothetical protein
LPAMIRKKVARRTAELKLSWKQQGSFNKFMTF